MRPTRRSFLGGAIGSIALLFGGFGWKEEEVWERGEDVPMTATEVVRDVDRWRRMQNVTARAMAKQSKLTWEELRATWVVPDSEVVERQLFYGNPQPTSWVEDIWDQPSSNFVVHPAGWLEMRSEQDEAVRVGPPDTKIKYWSED